MGKNVEIMPTANFLGNYSLTIGDNCFIGHQTLFMGGSNSAIILEDRVSISSRVTLSTGTHLFSSDGDRVVKEGLCQDIKICAGAGIMMGAMILPGVTVGSMALIGAGGVVTKDVPEFHLVGGVPAKVIRDMRDPRKL